jgi:Zn-dependent protease with chaperone function
MLLMYLRFRVWARESGEGTEMPEGLALRDFVCPKCTEKARLDPRFVSWCTRCGYGADPKPQERSGRALRRSGREQRRSTRLFESLRTAQDLRPTSATGVSVTALSGVVHLVGLGVLALPILLVVDAHGAVWSYFVLALCLLTYWTVRPRLPQRYLDPRKSLTRQNAPKLYALLDRCAAEIGSPVPDLVSLDLRFNAATGRAGLRQRTFMLLGLPLWTVLSGQERLALLGHELAHQVNGDTTHGLWAGSARRSIHEWTRLLDPRQTAYERRNSRIMTRGRGFSGIGTLMAPVIMAIAFSPFFLIALGCRVLLTRLDLYCGQRAEYLADELGARLAGSEAAYGLLAKLALADPVLSFLTAAKNRGMRANKVAPDRLWPSVAEYVDSIPETERQRRKIVDRLRNTRTDRSHPASHLRIALIEARPQWPGALKVSEDEWAEIDAELAPGYLGGARRLLGG